MAEALDVTVSQLNLDGISEELTTIDSQLIENKTSEEKKVDSLKSDNNGAHKMIFKKVFGPKLTTVLENMKLYFGHSNFKSISQKNTIFSILRRKCNEI